MALRDTSWVMTGGGPGNTLDSQSVLVEYDKDISEDAWLTDGTHLVRTRTIITREWVALTAAAAQAVVDCKAVASNADPNTKYKCRLDNRIVNSWVVTQAVDSMGPWGAA